MRKWCDLVVKYEGKQDNPSPADYSTYNPKAAVKPGATMRFRRNRTPSPRPGPADYSHVDIRAYPSGKVRPGVSFPKSKRPEPYTEGPGPTVYPNLSGTSADPRPTFRPATASSALPPSAFDPTSTVRAPTAPLPSTKDPRVRRAKERHRRASVAARKGIAVEAAAPLSPRLLTPTYSNAQKTRLRMVDAAAAGLAVPAVSNPVVLSALLGGHSNILDTCAGTAAQLIGDLMGTTAAPTRPPPVTVRPETAAALAAAAAAAAAAADASPMRGGGKAAWSPSARAAAKAAAAAYAAAAATTGSWAGAAEAGGDGVASLAGASGAAAVTRAGSATATRFSRDPAVSNHPPPTLVVRPRTPRTLRKERRDGWMGAKVGLGSRGEYGGVLPPTASPAVAATYGRPHASTTAAPDVAAAALHLLTELAVETSNGPGPAAPDVGAGTDTRSIATRVGITAGPRSGLGGVIPQSSTVAAAAAEVAGAVHGLRREVGGADAHGVYEAMVSRAGRTQLRRRARSVPDVSDAYYRNASGGYSRSRVPAAGDVTLYRRGGASSPMPLSPQPRATWLSAIAQDSEAKPLATWEARIGFLDSAGSAMSPSASRGRGGHAPGGVLALSSPPTGMAKGAAFAPPTRPFPAALSLAAAPSPSAFHGVSAAAATRIGRTSGPFGSNGDDSRLGIGSSPARARRPASAPPQRPHSYSPARSGVRPGHHLTAGAGAGADDGAGAGAGDVSVYLPTPLVIPPTRGTTPTLLRTPLRAVHTSGLTPGAGEVVGPPTGAAAPGVCSYDTEAAKDATLPRSPSAVVSGRHTWNVRGVDTEDARAEREHPMVRLHEAAAIAAVYAATADQVGRGDEPWGGDQLGMGMVGLLSYGGRGASGSPDRRSASPRGAGGVGMGVTREWEARIRTSSRRARLISSGGPGAPTEDVGHGSMRGKKSKSKRDKQRLAVADPIVDRLMTPTFASDTKLKRGPIHSRQLSYM